MIGVSWHYPISKSFLEEIEEKSGNVAAGFILLEPVLSSRSCFLSLAIQFFFIFDSSRHRYSRNHRTTPLEDNVCWQCPPMPWFCCRTLAWNQQLHAGAQYRSCCECRGDLNTSPFSSVHITLSNHNSQTVSQNLHAGFYRLVGRRRTWAVCAWKLTILNPFAELSTPFPYWGSICWNILECGFYYFGRKVLHSLHSLHGERFYSCCFTRWRGTEILQPLSLRRLPLHEVYFGDSCGKNYF